MHPVAVRILLEAGTDPALRTRIDDCETPGELARRAGLGGVSAMLEEAEKARKNRI
jgi:uncharacterized protein